MKMSEVIVRISPESRMQGRRSSHPQRKDGAPPGGCPRSVKFFFGFLFSLYFWFFFPTVQGSHCFLFFFSFSLVFFSWLGFVFFFFRECLLEFVKKSGLRGHFGCHVGSLEGLWEAL